MGARYLRTQIVSFYELTEAQQAQQIEEYGIELSEESQYVANPTYDGEVLPLHMFLRNEYKGKYYGVYGTSYFSAYFLYFGKDGEDCVIADRWN